MITILNTLSDSDITGQMFAHVLNQSNTSVLPDCYNWCRVATKTCIKFQENAHIFWNTLKTPATSLWIFWEKICFVNVDSRLWASVTQKKTENQQKQCFQIFWRLDQNSCSLTSWGPVKSHLLLSLWSPFWMKHFDRRSVKSRSGFVQ